MVFAIVVKSDIMETSFMKLEDRFLFYLPSPPFMIHIDDRNSF